MPDVPRPRSRKPSAKTDTTETTGSTTKAPPDPPPTPATTRTPADRKLAESVAAMYSGVGMLVMGIGVPRAHATGDERLVATGIEIQGQAETFAEAWMNLADKNPKVKAALKKATEGGAFAEVFALHVALLLPYLPGIPGLSGLSTAATNGQGVGARG